MITGNSEKTGKEQFLIHLTWTSKLKKKHNSSNNNNNNTTMIIINNQKYENCTNKLNIFKTWAFVQKYGWGVSLHILEKGCRNLKKNLTVIISRGCAHQFIHIYISWILYFYYETNFTCRIKPPSKSTSPHKSTPLWELRQFSFHRYRESNSK